MSARTYYLCTDGKWYTFDDGRWQFVEGMPEERALQAILVAHNSDIILTLPGYERELELLRKAQADLQFKSNQKWQLFFYQREAVV